MSNAGSTQINKTWHSQWAPTVTEVIIQTNKIAQTNQSRNMQTDIE